MTDEISFPPLRDLPPGRHQARRQHLLSEIRREPAPRRPLAAMIPRFRLRFALPAAAALGVAAVCAVVFSGALGRSGTHPPSNSGVWSAYDLQNAAPPFSAMNLNFNRAGQGITSIDVTVNAATVGGTALVQVVRGAAADISQTSLAGGKVVFRQQVAMSTIASPRSGPPGTEALSTWSGTLSSSDWGGGCQNDRYVITVEVSPAHPTREAQGEWVESGWFTCRLGSDSGGSR